MPENRAGRGQLFRWLTGRGDVPVDNGRDIRGMLLAAGGPSDRTRSGIDLTAAAKKLGVSRRTVERWHRTAQTGQGQRPSPAHLKSLAKAARQAATTRAGRAQWLASVRADPKFAGGAFVTIDALQGPGDSEGEWMRDRKITHTLSRVDLEELWDAYERGGDRGVGGWIDQRGEEYLSGWQTGAIGSITVQSEDEYRDRRRRP